MKRKEVLKQLKNELDKAGDYAIEHGENTINISWKV